MEEKIMTNEEMLEQAEAQAFEQLEEELAQEKQS